MKIKNRISKIIISLGVVCVLISAFLFVKNEQIEQNAKTYSSNAVENIKEQIEVYEQEEENISEEFEELLNFDNEFTYEDLAQETTLENETYIGVLSFLSLDLELAVQSDWSYEKLYDTPCVYKEEPFSIAGHNYSSHFGKLSKLELGDIVVFTDTSGKEFVFTVVLSTIVSETEIEELEDDSYDLTLFTCNYKDNNERILVRLNLLQE